MIIYKCIITGDEMFSDIYKIVERSDGIFYEIQGKMVSRTDQIDDSKFGANASAEEAGEENCAGTVTGVDIVLNHNLQETGFDKKSYMAYIKDYMKAVKKHLEENDPDKVDEFQEKAKVAVKDVVGRLKNYQFFTGENMNPDGMVALLDYKEDGCTPFMLFFKHGLVEEKC